AASAGARRGGGRARARGRRRGLGIASYGEATAPSSKIWQMLGPAAGGFEPAMVRMETDGRVVVAVGVNSQGQSHETTLAQIAADRLGISLGDVRVVQGGTETPPRRWGTRGSRTPLPTGGAVLLAAH